MKTDIILAGVGGQGILTIATIIGKAALNCGINLRQAEVHGMSQRGGDVQSNLRLSDQEIYSDLIPLGKADVIASMEPMEALRYLPFLNQRGRIVTNTAPFVNIPDYPDTALLESELYTLDDVVAFDMDAAAKELQAPRSSNIVLLGALSPSIIVPSEEIRNAVAQHFAPKGDKVVTQNIRAFDYGYVKATV